MKYRSLKLWESERPSRPLYQLIVDGVKKDIIGGSPPVFPEVRHSQSDWKLVEYPRKEILKELSEEMKTEKNENETKSKTTI